jgi:hypothetical protein
VPREHSLKRVPVRDGVFDPSRLAEIMGRLEKLTPQNERQWGRMTVDQMISHLCDGYRQALGDRPVPSRSTVYERVIVRWVGLHTPFRWPRGAKTTPEADQLQGGTPPAEFERGVSDLRALLRRVVEAGDGLEGHAHPTLGPLTTREWGTWCYRHADHHLRQFTA